VSVLLWLFVIVLGTAFGAGLYELRVVVPLWTSSPPASLAAPDSGRRFWALITTGPLTLLTLANLVAAWQSHGALRGWWLTAAIVTMAERVATFGYFIPTIIRLHRRPASEESAVRAALARWVRLNYARNAMTLVSWIAALQAFALL
jgi:hypothetical protein